MKAYWREFIDGVRSWWAELAADGNYLGLAVLVVSLVVSLPLVLVAAVLAWMGDIGPE